MKPFWTDVAPVEEGRRERSEAPRRPPARDRARWFLLGLIACAGVSPASAEPFEFALVGDYPYFPRDDAGMPHLLEDLRSAPDLAWILHLGDLHNPRATDCSEALFRARHDAFVALGHPFVFTPGDNDWADCGDGEREWLALVRDVFFGEGARVLEGADLVVRSQAANGGLVENLMWERDGVVFATLHMIAGPGPPYDILDGIREDRAALRAAGRAWLDETFRVARQREARGVFLATQVSLWPHTGNPQLLHVIDPEHLEPPHGFRPFLSALAVHARAFGRPVAFANGDTHVFRIDKPLLDERLETLQNFTRVEGFGSPHGHWVRVRVEPDREEVFSFRQEWVTENLYTLVPPDERTDGFEEDGIGPLIWIVRVLQWAPSALAALGAFVLVRFLGRGLIARLGRSRRDGEPSD